MIDDFLPADLIEEILRNFPAQPLRDDKFYENGMSGLHKRQVFPINCNDYVRNLFNFFNSAPVLQFLEGLTGIDALIPDPYFSGGGFHEIAHGGKLGVHADFRLNEQLHVARRLNLLIYLNKNWDDSYGGFLELWDKSVSNRIQTIAPILNRCVIFNTDADSYHGHPDPLTTPDGVTRKSIALYYYTASERIYEDMPAHSTMYVARATDTAGIQLSALKLRARNYFKDWMPPVIYRRIMAMRNAQTKKD